MNDIKSASMRILIRDLRLEMSIGAYDHERLKTQPVIVNIEADVVMPDNPKSDRLDDWVCYATAVKTIQALASRGHIQLLETFASLIADALMTDPRITKITVRLEKPEAISEIHSVGIELTMFSATIL